MTPSGMTRQCLNQRYRMLLLRHCQTASMKRLAPTVHSKHKPQGLNSLFRVKKLGVAYVQKSCLSAGNTIIMNSGKQAQFDLQEIEVSVQ
jgi:hypothetical protein